jgi:hypothetical protein
VCPLFRSSLTGAGISRTKLSYTSTNGPRSSSRSRVSAERTDISSLKEMLRGSGGGAATWSSGEKHASSVHQTDESTETKAVGHPYHTCILVEDVGPRQRPRDGCRARSQRARRAPRRGNSRKVRLRTGITHDLRDMESRRDLDLQMCRSRGLSRSQGRRSEAHLAGRRDDLAGRRGSRGVNDIHLLSSPPHMQMKPPTGGGGRSRARRRGCASWTHSRQVYYVKVSDPVVQLLVVVANRNSPVFRAQIGQGSSSICGSICHGTMS